MATHPDITEPADYPLSLSGLMDVAKDFPKEDLGVRVPEPEEVADSADYNKVARNFFALVEDIRDFIMAMKAFGGGGGGGGGSPFGFKWWPQRVYSPCTELTASTPFGDGFSNAQMEGCALWVPNTETFDAFIGYLGFAFGGGGGGGADFDAADRVQFGLYDNDDLVSGWWPKDLIVSSEITDLTVHNPVNGQKIQLVETIPDTVLTGGKWYWLIMYHNISHDQAKTHRSTRLEYGTSIGIGFGPDFIRGVNAQQFPYDDLPSTFPFIGIGFESGNVSPAPPYIGLRRK